MKIIGETIDWSKFSASIIDVSVDDFLPEDYCVYCVWNFVGDEEDPQVELHEWDIRVDFDDTLAKVEKRAERVIIDIIEAEICHLIGAWATREYEKEVEQGGW